FGFPALVLGLARAAVLARLLVRFALGAALVVLILGLVRLPLLPARVLGLAGLAVGFLGLVTLILLAAALVPGLARLRALTFLLAGLLRLLAWRAGAILAPRLVLLFELFVLFLVMFLLTLRRLLLLLFQLLLVRGRLRDLHLAVDAGARL